MKVELENKNVISTKLKIIYGLIILFCIISIIVAIVLQFTKDDNSEETPNLPSLSEEQTMQHETEFDNIFENKVNYLENNSYKITKIEQDKEIIYTGYQDNNKKINDYELDVNIPYINIGNNALIDSYNQEIRDVFETKAKSVLNTQNSSIIYTVNYSAYISNNILSLVIRSTLKGTLISFDIPGKKSHFEGYFTASDGNSFRGVFTSAVCGKVTYSSGKKI